MAVCDQDHGGVAVPVAGPLAGSLLESLDLLFAQIFPGPKLGQATAIREMAAALYVSRATAWRALRVLQDRGFVVQTKRGAFSLKARHATEWRLTEFGDDVTDALATKDFARWEKQNTVSPMKPSGFTRSTVRAL